jgi:hypothetical protein
MSPVGLLVVVSLLTSLVSGQPTVDSESCTGDSSYQQSLQLSRQNQEISGQRLLAQQVEQLSSENEDISRQIQEILAAMQYHQQQMTLMFTLSGWSRQQLQAALLLTSKCLVSVCVSRSDNRVTGILANSVCWWNHPLGTPQLMLL